MILVQLPPLFVLTCHWYIRFGSVPADAVKLALAPGAALTSVGCVVTVGAGGIVVVEVWSVPISELPCDEPKPIPLFAKAVQMVQALEPLYKLRSAARMASLASI